MYSGMCNALSPEKAVIWSVLHDLASVDLSAEHFTHPAYRVWFDAVRELRQGNAKINAHTIHAVAHARGHGVRELDRRALQRMLRIAPPARIADNAQLLCQALVDRHLGKPVHIEKLIN